MATLKNSPKFPEIYAARCDGASITALAARYGYAESTLRLALKSPLTQSTPPPQAAPPESEWRMAPAPIAPAKQAAKQGAKAPSHGGKWKRFVAFSDSHGAHRHDKTIESLIDFTDDWKPHHLIGLGDFWDYGPMRDGATIEERSESVRPDWEKGCEVLHRFFSGRDAQKHVVLGNHCHRAYKWLTKTDAIQRAFAEHKVSLMENLWETMGVTWQPYHKRSMVQIGKLTGVHGFGGGGVNAAKTHAQAFATGPGSTIIFGHTHRVGVHSEANIAAPRCYNIGACCELDLGYNDLQLGTLAQSHGFVYGAISEASGSVVIWQAQEIDGDWLLPSDVAGS